MKRKKIMAFITALMLGTGMLQTIPVYAKSIWDLPGAPEETEISDSELEEYLTETEKIEVLREDITEEETLTPDAQSDLLKSGPASVYARASGDTPGWWDDSTGYWMYWLSNEGRWATNEWIKQGGDWYFLDGNGHMKSGLFWAPDGNAYYCNASGVMQTGWQNLGGQYKWYYFDANGAWLVTSDIKGCSHGVLCVGTNHYHMSSMNIKYYNLSGTGYSSAIRSGANMWNSATNVVSISEGNDTNANVTIEQQLYGTNVVAVTAVGNSGSLNTFENVSSDWSKARISVNERRTAQSRDFAHEFGHCFGLTHHKDSRYGYRYSIMYPDSVSGMKIQIYDVNVLGHIRQY